MSGSLVQAACVRDGGGMRGGGGKVGWPMVGSVGQRAERNRFQSKKNKNETRE